MGLEHGVFMPHGHCYFWDSNILWQSILGDFLIAMSCAILTIILHKESMRQDNAVMVRILRVYALFILFCGVGHLIDIANIWLAQYKFKSLWSIMTGLISLAALNSSFLVIRYINATKFDVLTREKRK